MPPVSGTDATVPADDTELAGARPEPRPGSLCAGIELEGRYRLVARLGAGGMGEVWEAQHMVLGRIVAIKLLLANTSDPELAVRLQREADLVARLEHPNIVVVTDVGLVAERQPFVVMERLYGRTLSELLRERGALPWRLAREIAVQLAAGLACAHAAGIVHRDLKPSNVFVLDDPDGRARIKIIDFGLAKATQIGPGERALTKSGAVFGSPAYMAPEQVRGEPLDGRADLYALGAIVYEMIVGAPLWRRGSMFQLLYCQLFEAAPTIRSRVPEAPAELDVLVARCLCKDRALRPADTEELRMALVGVGSGAGVTIAVEETIPVAAAEVRARYATMAPVAEEVSIPTILAAAPRRSTPPRRVTPPRRATQMRWLVPAILVAAASASGVVALQGLPPAGLGSSTAPNDVTPNDVTPNDVTPNDAAPSKSTPAAAPSRDVSVTGVSTATGETTGRPASDVEVTPAIEPAAVKPIDDGPSRPRTKPRAGTRPPLRADPPPASTPTAEPTPTPTPETKPPVPLVPKRKGDTLDWPTPGAP